MPDPRPAGCFLVFIGGFFTVVATIFLVFFAVAAFGVIPAQIQGPMWLFALIPVVHLVLGLAVLTAGIRRLRDRSDATPSPESRGANPRSTVATAFSTAAEPVVMGGEWPTVTRVTRRPGRTLPHALERGDLSVGCQFGCLLLFVVGWNSIVCVFVWNDIAQARRGNPNWFQLVFLVPFVLVGLFLLGAVIYAGFKWLVSLLVGKLDVELSAHPLAPGGRYELAVAQRGTFRLARVVVTLVCEEAATYVAGTDKTTSKKVVLDHPVTDGEADALPLAAGFTVPPGAMHSFKAPNNEIDWKLRVRGRVLGVLPFADEFVLAVWPAGATLVDTGDA